MDRPTSISLNIWDSFSDEARAVVEAVIDGLEHQVSEAGVGSSGCCWQRARDVPRFLTACLQARMVGVPPPNLAD